jgi:hypothetical protein
VPFPGDPVLDIGDPGEIDDEGAGAPNVLLDGSIYKMWYGCYGGDTNRLGYAESPDGLTWEKHNEKLVLENGDPGEWDEEIWTATVIFNGSSYEMWYSGRDDMNDYRTGYARSDSGLIWSKYVDNPVLDLGPSGSFDDRWATEPYVIKNGSNYEMWYVAYDGTNQRVGYAISTDGYNWEKVDSLNPVLDLGSQGEWDDVRASAPSVLLEGMTYHMWYHGYDGESMQIGYAIDATGTGIEDEVIHVPFAFSLAQNYPNPFNPSTTIQYDILMGSGQVPVKIFVYDVRGRLIRKLVNEEKDPGSYSVNWDGRDNIGHRVASGIYIYRMQINHNLVSTKKMVLLK